MATFAGFQILSVANVASELLISPELCGVWASEATWLLVGALVVGRGLWATGFLWLLGTRLSPLPHLPRPAGRALFLRTLSFPRVRPVPGLARCQCCHQTKSQTGQRVQGVVPPLHHGEGAAGAGARDLLVLPGQEWLIWGLRAKTQAMKRGAQI